MPGTVGTGDKPDIPIVQDVCWVEASGIALANHTRNGGQRDEIIQGGGTTWWSAVGATTVGASAVGSSLRGANVAYNDGSARFVPLGELFPITYNVDKVYYLDVPVRMR